MRLASNCASRIRISIHPLRAERDRAEADAAVEEARFQSTRSVRSGTRRGRRPACVRPISIHPLRAERDCSRAPTPPGSWSISIHPLRAERDPFMPLFCSDNAQDFNPPAPCGAGPFRLSSFELVGSISIHPLRAERDSPLWHNDEKRGWISIHPLRAERDEASQDRQK